MASVVEAAKSVAYAPMTQAEFNIACKDVRNNFASAGRHIVAARRKMLEIYRRKGWQPTYKSWRDCVMVEFGLKVAHCYRLLNAAITDEDIAPVHDFSEVPETVLRPLQGLPPEKKQEAFVKAVETAGGEVPTERQMQEAVKEVDPSKEFSPRGEKPDEPKDVAKARKSGIIPEGVAVTIEEGQTTAPEIEPGVPIEQSDDEYLAEFPVREKLSPIVRKRFDAYALAFRDVTPARVKFVNTVRERFEQAKKAAGHHIGPWLNLYYRFAQAKDPSRWVICKACNGTGEESLVGKCADCHGEGFHVR